MNDARPWVRLVVDGEVFEAQERHDRPGQHDFIWISGPNPGYGFTSATSDGAAQSLSALEDAARNFLAQVDRETGFID